MLAEICAYLHNYFTNDADKHLGKFTITGGVLAPPSFLKEGQYFRIVGSTYNDGVYQYPAAGLTDEDFSGAVWAMAVPPAVIALSADIKEYAQSDAGKPSAFTSESFGGYSYSRATDKSGAPISWQTAFGARLAPWKKVR